MPEDTPDTKHRQSYREGACELFAALMKGPRTQRDLQEMTGLCESPVVGWLRAMEASGLVQTRKGSRPCATTPGRTATVYELNPYPFMPVEREMMLVNSRCYLAGPMSGLPDLNFPAFNAAAERLRELGWLVENPAENPDPPGGAWRDYMRLALAQLVRCDTVALLPGWEQSRGARVEWLVARNLGLRVRRVDQLAEAPRVLEA